MKFSIGFGVDIDNFYWIGLDCDIIVNDYEIAGILGIDIKQYRNELLQFVSHKQNIHKNNETTVGTIDDTTIAQYCVDDDIIFFSRSDVDTALEYLNNKYGIILAMID